MDNFKTVKTGHYVAVDVDGKKHLISVLTTTGELRELSGRTSRHKTKEQHVTQNGHHVNVYDDGTLEDVVSGIKMRRVE